MINFYWFLDQQSSEDTRSFIIHYPARSGKTTFARNAAAHRSGIYYLDLQETFLSKSDLPPITQCGFDFLKDFLLGLEIPEEFVIIDNPDFLFNTWKPAEKKDFLYWIKIKLRSPGVTKKTFVFFFQSDEILATEQFKNSRGQLRVLSLNEFEAL